MPTRKFVVTVALVSIGCLGASPAGAAKPTCAIDNARTHAEYTTLQDAVNAAASGDTLEIKGVCAGSTIVGRDVVLKGVAKKAFGPATLTGANAGRVLRVNAPSTTTVRGLTLTGGNTTDGGGIIVRSGATARVADSLIYGNTASGFGGGIEVFPTGTLTVTNSVVRNNQAASSGGIDSDHGTVTVESSAVRDNTASAGANCVAAGFSCAGGLWNFGGTMTLRDTVVSGNSAGYQGGGVRNQTVSGEPAGVLTLLGATTLSGNHAGDSGGGVSDASGVYDVTAWTGSIFANAPDQCSPAVPALGC
jgi:Right handed beta helix region